MTTLNFPASPTVGKTYAANNVIYTWNGTFWAANNAQGLDTRFVNVTGDTMTGNLTVPSLNGGQLAGFRNVIINGDLTINQRGVAIASVATGAYGQDRWKKTAGGMTQIIEAGNFEPSATYTLSGTGVTTQQLTAPASGNWTLPDIPVTARKIQLELGTVATSFEHRPIGTELALCQRYYQALNDIPPNGIGPVGIAQAQEATNLIVYMPTKVSMRVPPTVGLPSTTPYQLQVNGAAIGNLNFGTDQSSASGVFVKAHLNTGAVTVGSTGRLFSASTAAVPFTADAEL